MKINFRKHPPSILLGVLGTLIVLCTMASRNGSGTYTLPAGNPVVSGTTISTTWANNTLGDIRDALTQSVSKDGQTAMTGNLPMGDNKLLGLSVGTAGTPSVSFTSDTDTGLFSPGSDQVGLSTNGVVRLSVNTTAITGALPFYQAAGTASAPSYSWAGDPNTGFYNSSADVIAVATNGGLRGTFGAPILWGDGAVGAPAYSFSSDANTGIYRIGSDNIGVAVAGGKVLDISATAIDVNAPLTHYGNNIYELRKAKASTTSRTSTISLADDPELAFTVGETGYYEIEALLNFVAATDGTQGIVIGFDYSSTHSTEMYTYNGWVNGAAVTRAQPLTNGATGWQFSDVTTLSAGDWVRVSGHIRITAAGGTFSMQWCQQASSGNATQMLVGSWIKLTKMG